MNMEKENNSLRDSETLKELILKLNERSFLKCSI